jgi:hypothetical protein
VIVGIYKKNEKVNPVACLPSPHPASATGTTTTCHATRVVAQRRMQRKRAHPVHTPQYHPTVRAGAAHPTVPPSRKVGGAPRAGWRTVTATDGGLLLCTIIDATTPAIHWAGERESEDLQKAATARGGARPHADTHYAYIGAYHTKCAWLYGLPAMATPALRLASCHG